MQLFRWVTTTIMIQYSIWNMSYKKQPDCDPFLLFTAVSFCQKSWEENRTRPISFPSMRPLFLLKKKPFLDFLDLESMFRYENSLLHGSVWSLCWQLMLTLLQMCYSMKPRLSGHAGSWLSVSLVQKKKINPYVRQPECALMGQELLTKENWQMCVCRAAPHHSLHKKTCW